MRPLLDVYREFAVDHGRRSFEGDSDRTNLAYDGLQIAFRALADAGVTQDLYSLFEDEDAWVQLWAATHTLELDATRALDKLQKLEEADIPLVSTSAKYVRQGWLDSY